MRHDDFVARAKETATNAGGVRRLAPHVRLLYNEIRLLQADDNAYFYIAQVISDARNDKLDVQLIADRVRVYHHRDRRERGHKPIHRGLGPDLDSVGDTGHDDARAAEQDDEAHAAGQDQEIGSEGHQFRSDPILQQGDADRGYGTGMPPRHVAESHATDCAERLERNALTRNSYRRPRQVIDGGG